MEKKIKKIIRKEKEILKLYRKNKISRSTYYRGLARGYIILNYHQREIGRDDKSFIKIIPKYKNFIFSICRTYSIEGYDTEDLMQECYIRLLELSKYFKEQKKLGGYIGRVCRFKIFDILKKQKAEKRAIEIYLQKNQKKEVI